MVNRRRAVSITALATDLVAEERTFAALLLALGMARRAVLGVTAVLTSALAEQLRKKTHGRFPLTETDPPVGQDEPRSITPADPDTFTTSVSSGQFPPRTTVVVRRPPATSCPCRGTPLSPSPYEDD